MILFAKMPQRKIEIKSENKYFLWLFHAYLKCTDGTRRIALSLLLFEKFTTLSKISVIAKGKMNQTVERGWNKKKIFKFILFDLSQNNKQKCFMNIPMAIAYKSIMM